MASTKLTNWIREQIVADLMAHRFTKACDKLVSDRAAFAGRVYRDVYSLTARKRMDDLPEGWLPVASYIGVQFGDGGGYEQLSFNGSVGGAISRLLSVPIDTVSKRVFDCHDRRCAKVYEATHPLAASSADLVKRRDDLITQIDAAQRQAEAAVNSVTTINRLIELWPEVEPFARKHESAKAQLPALPTSELNALLDLPVAA